MADHLRTLVAEHFEESVVRLQDATDCVLVSTDVQNACVLFEKHVRVLSRLLNLVLVLVHLISEDITTKSY